MCLVQSHSAWDSDSGGSYATPGVLSKRVSSLQLESEAQALVGLT